MKLLLDTHTLLWWLADDPKLGPQSRQRVAEPENDILVSIVSLWEITLKCRLGKLDANLSEILKAIASFRRLDVQDSHLQTLQTLPLHHRDPFDHLLIAQALAEAATFLSADRYVPLYPVPNLSALA